MADMDWVEHRRKQQAENSTKHVLEVAVSRRRNSMVRMQASSYGGADAYDDMRQQQMLEEEFGGAWPATSPGAVNEGSDDDAVTVMAEAMDGDKRAPARSMYEQMYHFHNQAAPVSPRSKAPSMPGPPVRSALSFSASPNGSLMSGAPAAPQHPSMLLVSRAKSHTAAGAVGPQDVMRARRASAVMQASIIGHHQSSGPPPIIPDRTANGWSGEGQTVQERRRCSTAMGEANQVAHGPRAPSRSSDALSQERSAPATSNAAEILLRKEARLAHAKLALSSTPFSLVPSIDVSAPASASPWPAASSSPLSPGRELYAAASASAPAGDTGSSFRASNDVQPAGLRGSYAGGGGGNGEDLVPSPPLRGAGTGLNLMTAAPPGRSVTSQPLPRRQGAEDAEDDEVGDGMHGGRRLQLQPIRSRRSLPLVAGDEKYSMEPIDVYEAVTTSGPSFSAASFSTTKGKIKSFSRLNTGALVSDAPTDAVLGPPSHPSLRAAPSRRSSMAHMMADGDGAMPEGNTPLSGNLAPARSAASVTGSRSRRASFMSANTQGDWTHNGGGAVSGRGDGGVAAAAAAAVAATQIPVMAPPSPPPGGARLAAAFVTKSKSGRHDMKADGKDEGSLSGWLTKIKTMWKPKKGTAAAR